MYQDDSKHCFSCGWHVFPKHYKPKEVVPNVHKALLPGDFTREVPTAALRWVLQYGLPWSYWKDQIGYSPSEERLVFLVGTPTQFSIGRYVGNAEVKPRKWYVWGDSHKHCEVVAGESSSLDGIILVEDLISAHKVATSVPSVASVPLFGTQIHKPHLYYLMQENKPVVLWLDKDQQGTITRKAMGLQALLNVPVSVVVTDRDPKELSIKELNEALASTT